MKKLLFLIFFLGILSPALAVEPPPISPQQVEKYNNIIKNIYDELYARALEYSELKQLDKSALATNSLGLYSLEYEYVEFEGFRRLPEYKIGVEVTALDAPYSFTERSGKFEFEYPMLGIKVQGYQIRGLSTRHYDFQKLVIESIDPITEDEQAQLPLQLTIEPVKSEFMAIS